MVLKAGGEAEYNQLMAYYRLNDGDIAEQKLVFMSLGYAADQNLKVFCCCCFFLIGNGLSVCLSAASLFLNLE